MIQSEPDIRHCTMVAHKGSVVIWICTKIDCELPKRWMCEKCIELHFKHYEHCRPIAEFDEQIKKYTTEYIFQRRKELTKVIRSQLTNHKNQITSQFIKIEQQFEGWLIELEAVENMIYPTSAQSSITFTEETINNILRMNMDKEYQIFQESQVQGFNVMNNINQTIATLASSLELAVNVKHGIVKEQLEKSDYIMVGQYRIGVKVGEWSILNNEGEKMYQLVLNSSGGGSFNVLGRKVGLWIDVEQVEQYIIYNIVAPIFNIQVNTRMEGGLIIGQSKINFVESCMCRLQTRGGGYYNQEGNKVGEWIDIEFNEQFQQYNQSQQYVKHIGKYYDGSRIDNWDIINSLNEKMQQTNLQISGGGLYNQQGNKNKQWIDIKLNAYKIIKHIGKYTNGKQYGKWDIYAAEQQNTRMQEIQQRVSGGGFYNISGNKEKQWTDVEQNDGVFIQLTGKYDDGMRIGHWDVIQDDRIIGGGEYNDLGRKVKPWIDIEFNSEQYIQHIGQYEDGIRVAQWQVQGKVNGGGQYTKSGKKVQHWIDVQMNEFTLVQYIGNYNEGTKVDNWDIRDIQGNIIGGGAYNESGLKVGDWIDIEQKFNYYVQYIGKYNLGKRIDQWTIQKIKDKKYLGGGNYNQDGYKDQNWIDVELSDDLFIQHIGKYNNGIRVDHWEIKVESETIIGGGDYNQQGSKVGEWIDISVGFCSYDKHYGNYQDGRRIGKWDIKDQLDNPRQIMQQSSGEIQYALSDN